MSNINSEIEILQSIFHKEIVLKQEKENDIYIVDVNLKPLTGEKDEEQFVYLTLSFIITKEYPNILPEIKIKNSRGLSEEILQRIIINCSDQAEKLRGSFMLYELIETIREDLTNNNFPSEDCAICLVGFDPSDKFVRTPCYHYFHCYCLGSYIQRIPNQFSVQAHSTNKESLISPDINKQSVQCPICRSNFNIRLDFLKNATEPVLSHCYKDFIVSDELLKLQHKMKQLHEKQKLKGAIIDADEHVYLTN